MFDRLRDLDPPQPLHQILFYRFGYWALMAFYKLFYRIRFFEQENVPRSEGERGGLLIIANHQSHLDPPLVGLGLRRRNMAAIARQGLFKFPLGLLLRGVGCIPIREDSGDTGAMRVAIEQLKRGRVVVIFPEGSRSPDGSLQPFKRGVWLLMMRSGVPVLPAAVEGCFDAWPRRKALPRLFGQRVAASYGKPIPFAELKALGADAGLTRLAGDVETLRLDLREKLRQATHGRVPRPGPGDQRSLPATT